MRTAVVILNWNTRHFLSRFLPTLIDSVRGTDAEIIVADNGSTDASVELLREEFPELRCIALAENLGFTGGYNKAIAQLLADPAGRPEYILLINSDIELEPGWLEPLVDYMDKHPDCGVCGPKLHALEADGPVYTKSQRFEYAGAAGGYLDRYGFPFCRGRVLGLTETDCGQYGDSDSLMWVSGACLMTRSSLWERLGGLDSRFFAHMEEIDYCWRAQLCGYSIACVTQSCVYHLGGGTLPNSSVFKLKLNYRNSLLMLEKNLAPTIGKAGAERLLKRRMFIDRLTSIAYLLTGSKEKYKAVLDAHEEFRQMRSTGDKSPATGAQVRGIAGFSIIVQYALRGKRIFKYLRRYEDNNPRCR